MNWDSGRHKASVNFVAMNIEACRPGRAVVCATSADYALALAQGSV